LEKRKADQEVVGFACGLMGLSLFKRNMWYRGLLKKIGNLETQLALLKGNKEAIHTLSNTSLHDLRYCRSVTSRCELELVL